MDLIRQYDEAAASVRLHDGPRPPYQSSDAAEWHTKGIKQGLKIGRSILEVLVSTDKEVSDRLGKWMSAALDDPNVCEEMKNDIRAWFSAGQPLSAA